MQIFYVLLGPINQYRMLTNYTHDVHRFEIGSTLAVGGGASPRWDLQ